MAFCLATIFGVPWCQQLFGSVDLRTGRRGCGAEPSEIRAWSYENHGRPPGEVVNLQTWIARHPRQIDKAYGAFCDTPLLLAARFGRDDLAGPLIAAGANLEARNELDERPLQVSAKHGHPAVARLLLARGADVNASDSWGRTALHAAAAGIGDRSNLDSRIEIAKLLLAAGANVNARERGSGFTPLRYATSGDSRNIVMAGVLLSRGADPRDAEEQPRMSDLRER
jgi:hypothetical protein